MSKEETIQVITLLAGNYNSIAEKDKTQKQLMVNTWYECLGDLDYNLVLSAVKKAIISSPYPPTIHEVRKSAMELINPIQGNVLDSWDECYKMICNGTYMTQEEFDSHSEICKKFLGSTEQLRNYARSDIEVVNTVVKGQFMKQYDVLVKREQEDRLLPQSLKELTAKLTQNMSIKQIGE